MAGERRVKEDTKDSRETKVTEEQMGLMVARVKQGFLVLPAVKDLLDQTAHKEITAPRETPVLTEPKVLKVTLDLTETLDDQGTTAQLDPRANEDPQESMETRESGVMMAHLDQMDPVETEVQPERGVNKVPVVTEGLEETRESLDLGGSRAGRDPLAPTEIRVSLAGRGLQDTGETRAHLDLRDPRGQEESKDRKETKARSARGE